MNLSPVMMVAAITVLAEAAVVLALRRDKGLLIAVSPILLTCAAMVGQALYLIYGLRP